MVRVIMHGCNGVMGQVITGMAKDMEGLTIVAGIDLKNDKENGYPVYASLEECKEEADVVLRSANMSLGVNLLLKLVQEAAKVLASSGFDIEIVEKHHNQKKDAPSGTALALAESMNEALGNQYHYVYDRSSVHEKRDPKEIGIASVRGGSIVGDHDVIFAGKDEVITFNHTAYSKAIFAKGALEAAKFLAGKEPGLYDMSNVVQL